MSKNGEDLEEKVDTILAILEQEICRVDILINNQDADRDAYQQALEMFQNQIEQLQKENNQMSEIEKKLIILVVGLLIIITLFFFLWCWKI